MVNFASWTDIREFLKDPSQGNRGLLLSIPAFYTAYSDSRIKREELVEIIRWVKERSRVVMQALMIEGPLPDATPESLEGRDGDWRKVTHTAASHSECI